MTTPDVAIAKWAGPPASCTRGRRSGQPSVIVIHVTDGSEGPTSAEDGAAYDRRRTDGTSTHFFVDSNSIVQEVLVSDEAHAARTKGNDIGIQVEICGRASQSAAQWDDPVSAATVENVAKLCAALRKKYGTSRFPLIRLSGSALRDAWDGGKRRGFCGHVDITKAFPEDGGTHTDPGPNFPWSKLFARIAVLDGTAVTPRKVNTVKISVTMPVLKQGDDDDKLPGYNVISRMQKITGAKVDGSWGDETTTKIASWCGIDKSKAKVLNEDIYRKVFGLSAV